MTYYRIEPKLHEYGWFNLDMNKVIDALGRKLYRSFKRTDVSIGEYWEDFDARFEAADGEVDTGIRPDITTWGASCHLVVNQKAYDALKDLLSPFGEFLATPCEGTVYRIFNCQTTVKADEAASEKIINQGLQEGLKSLEFKDGDVENAPAFKTDYDLYASLFCGEEFKRLVKNHDLSGIEFKEDLEGSRYLASS